MDDPHRSARLLLDNDSRVLVAEVFSESSVAMLRDDLRADPRLRIAANTAGERGAVIQTLVGGPKLVRRFEAPSTTVDRYAAAVVSVALDARRLGHGHPFLTAFLAKASAAYLAEDDRIDAPSDWFEQGLRRAARDRSHGVTALLPRRMTDDQPGAADSYDLHDYLEQHSWQSRRFRSIPASLWEVSLDHSASVRDLSALGSSAYVRLIYGEAEPLLTAAADGGDEAATFRLVDLLALRQRFDEAVLRLGRFAAEGNLFARRPLVDLLARMRADEDLMEFVNGGDRYATWRLADVLEERGELGPLPTLLRQHDDRASRSRLVEVLLKLDRVDEALDLLRHGNSAAHFRMIGVLRDRGLVDELKNFEHVDGECVMGGLCAQHARSQLVELLAERGELDQVHKLAEDVDDVERRQFGLILWKHGHEEDARSIMRRSADAGDPMAMRYVNDMYRPAKRGRRKSRAPVVSRVLAPSARHRQANRLAEQHKVGELRALADTGYEYARWRLMNLLGELGNVTPLESAADTGDVRAHRRLVEILAGLGRVDELGRRVARGDGIARAELLWLASTRHHISHEEAVNLLRSGVRPDGSPVRSTSPAGFR